MTDEPKIGPTGQYPLGRPYGQDDRGSLYAAFGIEKRSRLAMMHFGTVIQYVNVETIHALSYTQMIRKRIIDNWGYLPYDKSSLPVKVEITGDKRFVKLTVPVLCSSLAGNPEMWLALAEVIEDRLRERNIID